MKLPHPKINVSGIARSKVTGSVIAILAFGGSVSYATVKIYDATRPPKLPANESCLKLADDVRSGLEGSQHQLAAVLSETPKPVVDLNAIKVSYQDCKNTADIYKVKVNK